MRTSPGDVGGNVARVAHLLDRARAGRADLALFPEAVVTGYDIRTFVGELPDLHFSAWAQPVQDAVDRTGVLAVVNTAMQENGRRTLSNLLFTPGNEPIAAYHKQHLYDEERTVFTPGTHGASFELNGLRFALSVCYDANFPEHAAAAARDEAHVYLNSGAYFPGGEHRRDLHLAARALDNGMYVAFSGLVGAPHGFIGGSAVFDPVGRRVTRIAEGEDVVFADLDPLVITSVRAEQRMWAHRRADLGAVRRLNNPAHAQRQ